MNSGFLIRRCEFAAPERYSGQGEVQFAVIGCLIWFAAIVVRLGFSPEVWTTTEMLVEALSFVVFAGIPVFFLATPGGANFAEKWLLKHHGLRFQTIICVLFTEYICLGKAFGLNPARFPWIGQLNNLIIENNVWLNTVLFLIGVFVVLRIPFLLLELRSQKANKYGISAAIASLKHNKELAILLLVNFIYVSLVNTSLISPSLKSDNSGYYVGLGYFLVFFLMHLPFAKQTSTRRFMVFDFLLTLACVGSLFWFSRPFFSFGVFVSLNLFILVVIFGTGLGREHFGYSFQVRRQDIRYTLKTILITAIILVPAAILLRFSAAESFQSFSNIKNGFAYFAFLLSYAILFSFRVGVFEEILFRCGLMIFIRDQIQDRSKSWLNRPQIVLLSAFICSVIFGLCHIGNDPGVGIALSPLVYKTIYAVLATIASLFYSLAFGETNRLWCSIVVHGVVDTTAVLLLGSSLTVPF